MKRKIIFLILLIILLVMPFASASIFGWITGRSVEGKPDLIVTEVKFPEHIEASKSFLASITIKNIGIAAKPEGDVVFAISTPLTSSRCIHGSVWSSLAPSESITKDFTFSCSELEKTSYGFPEGTYDIMAVIDYGKILDEADETNNELKKILVIETGKIPVPEVKEEVKEQVKCSFLNSNREQKCYTDDGRFVCSGIEACTAEVSGEKGKKLRWKSSCGNEVYTTIDGNNENAEFKCEQLEMPIPTTPAPVQEPPVPMLKERFKCIFLNSNSIQKCYTDDGRFSCTGIETCIIDVAEQANKMLRWKSSCNGEGSSQIDGTDKSAQFKCEQTQTMPMPTTPVITHPPTTPVTTPAPTKTPLPVPIPEETRDKVKLHYFYWEKECAACESEKLFLDKLREKYPQVEYDSYKIDLSSSKSYTYFVVSNLKQGKPTIFLDDKIWIGYDEDIAREIENKVKDCLEKGCSLTPAIPAMSTRPQIVPPETIPSLKEQVRCIFLNSDVLIRPHTAAREKCYSDDARFGCSWDGNVATEENGKRYAYCVADTYGNTGAKLTWKSSCGGYAYTLLDGSNEDAEFKCTPASEVKEEQIIGKGFKHAYWQCYDNAEQKPAASESVSCKSSEEWQRYAQEFCKGHCIKYEAEGISKCGVNSLEIEKIKKAKEKAEEAMREKEEKVREELRRERGEKKEMPVLPIEREKVPLEEKAKEEEKKEAILICKDSCPLDGKCYPFGYRKQVKYCSDEGAFKEQLEADGACENNFECSTNVCVDGKCMSSGTAEQALNAWRMHSKNANLPK
ncbi:hypothetical protein HYU06_01180 [Candidatus Woesearchaeota archaeon]|nr:hypothetical protein [Candidatus Woesearchaeota archaeon]